MLEIKGELVFKTVAYHRAADAIERSPVDLVAAYRDGHAAATPRRRHRPSATRSPSWRRPGTWPSTTGCAAEIPPGLVELLQIPGVGPKTVRQLHQELGIESLDDLRAAAETGRLRTIRGLSGKTEAQVLEGIARLDDRARRGCCSTGPRSSSTALMTALAARAGRPLDRAGRLVPAPPRVDRRPGPAGRDRRRRASLIDALHDDAGWPTGSSARARTRPPSGCVRGPQVDLMVMPPGEAGTYRIHFTGSKEHNVRLRAMARDRAGACPRRASCGSARTASR